MAYVGVALTLCTREVGGSGGMLPQKGKFGIFRLSESISGAFSKVSMINTQG